MKVAEFLKEIIFSINNIKQTEVIMETKNREELAQMSHEELENLVMTLQDDLDRESTLREFYYGKYRRNEKRFSVLGQMLDMWREEK